MYKFVNELLNNIKIVYDSPVENEAFFSLIVLFAGHLSSSSKGEYLYAKALRKLPTIIADNAGYDSSELISELRACHAAGCTTYGLSKFLFLLWIYFLLFFFSRHD
jgi:hypothetical protein